MKDQPLCCFIENEKLIISIGIDTLAFCAKEHPDFWNDEDEYFAFLHSRINIVDPLIFVKEICREMKKEAEDGSTLISRMIDKAITNACEDGCEGVEFHNIKEDKNG